MTNEYIIREEAMTLPVLPREQRIQLNNVDEAFEEGWRQALENLAILPAADVVEVKHGTWTWDRLRESYRCLSCRKHNADRTAFCPNC